MLRSMNYSRLVFVGVTLASLGSALTEQAAAQQGGIEVFAGETLFEQGTRISLSHIYKSKGTLRRGTREVADPSGSEWNEHRLVLGVDHGIDRDLTLSALIPVVDRSLTAGSADTQTRGLGDVALLAKYRILREEFPQGAFNVSLIGGAELPTGGTDERVGGVLLAPSLQPGSGAFSPFVAVGGTYSVGRARFDALGLYKANGEGEQDLEGGDFFVIGASAAYRYLHEKYPGPSASAKVGLQWSETGPSRMGGTRLENSGGRELLGRIGLGWHPVPQIDLTLSVDTPLSQDFDGQQLGLDLRTFLAVGVRF